MKPFIKTIAIAAVAMSPFFTSCTNASKKTDQVEADNRKLNIEKEEKAHKLDEEVYRRTVIEQLEANEQSIIAFNARIASQKNEARADYEQKIAVLNNKNSDMRKKMEDFKADNAQSWEAFKIEFGHDMKELGTAFQDFTIKNK